MKDLIEYIKESLLDDFDDLSNKSDELFEHPLMWLYKQIGSGKSLGEAVKILDTFREIFTKNNSNTELKNNRKLPKTGFYSKYWEPISVYKLNNMHLLCKFADIKDQISFDTSHELFCIGLGDRPSSNKNTDTLILKLINNKVVWYLSKNNKALNLRPISYNDQLYLCNDKTLLNDFIKIYHKDIK